MGDIAGIGKESSVLTAFHKPTYWLHFLLTVAACCPYVMRQAVVTHLLNLKVTRDFCTVAGL
jgi:hypothetical protein